MSSAVGRFDVIIIGSGYAGSMLATILAKRGRAVLLLDRNKHPRFAIGESTTPIADTLLHRLAEKYDIPQWLPLCKYGTWQQSYPHVRCGLKRGFSYFCHQANRPFQDDKDHNNSLLVAASTNDFASDTHWMRSDVDQLLCSIATQYGVSYLETAQVLALEELPNGWMIQIEDTSTKTKRKLNCAWLIDASGSNEFSRRYLGSGNCDNDLKTDTRASFAHFVGVEPFRAQTAEKNTIFDIDSAAQHHITPEGWCWMLRFQNDITSVGIVTPNNHSSVADATTENRFERWKKYPSIAALLRNARPIDSTQQTEAGAMQTGVIRHWGRLSRMNVRAYGVAWIALPAAFGFIDPLHSTGIAQSIAGVGKVAEILLDDTSLQQVRLVKYEQDLKRQLCWIDTLVSLCYVSLPDPQLFMAMTAWYFVSVITAEQALQKEGSLDRIGFLACNDQTLFNRVEAIYNKLITVERQSVAAWHDELSRAIAPWNTIGLLDINNCNRFEHRDINWVSTF